jgi:hypothetical protein
MRPAALNDALALTSRRDAVFAATTLAAAIRPKSGRLCAQSLAAADPNRTPALTSSWLAISQATTLAAAIRPKNGRLCLQSLAAADPNRTPALTSSRIAISQATTLAAAIRPKSCRVRAPQTSHRFTDDAGEGTHFGPVGAIGGAASIVKIEDSIEGFSDSDGNSRIRSCESASGAPGSNRTSSTT